MKHDMLPAFLIKVLILTITVLLPTFYFINNADAQINRNHPSTAANNNFNQQYNVIESNDRTNHFFIKAATTYNIISSSYELLVKSKIFGDNSDTNNMNTFGAELALDYSLLERISFGLDLTLINIDMKNTELVSANDNSIMESTIIPLNLVTKLYFSSLDSPGIFKIYIGAGIGYNYLLDSTSKESNEIYANMSYLSMWNFNTQMQIGVNLWLGKKFALSASAKKYFSLSVLGKSKKISNTNVLVSLNPVLLTIGITYKV